MVVQGRLERCGVQESSRPVRKMGRTLTTRSQQLNPSVPLPSEGLRLTLSETEETARFTKTVFNLAQGLVCATQGARAQALTKLTKKSCLPGVNWSPYGKRTMLAAKSFAEVQVKPHLPISDWSLRTQTADAQVPVPDTSGDQCWRR